MSQQRILWGAIAFSTVAYLIVLFVIAPNPPHTSLEWATLHPFVKILYPMALVAFLMGWFLPGRVTGPAQVRMIVAMAIFESCAIFGLMCAFVTHDIRLYFGPWALAVIGFIRSFPRAEIATRPGSM